MRLPNFDFSTGFLHWRTTRDNEAAFSSHDGILEVVFRHASWSVEHKSLIPVKAGEHYVLDVEARCGFLDRDSALYPNHATVSADMLGADMRPVRVEIKDWKYGDPGEPFMVTSLGEWRCGEIGFSGNWGWRGATCFFRVPPGTSFMRMSMRGRGSGEFSARNLSLREGAIEGTLAKRRPVAGDRPLARVHARISLGDYAAKFVRGGDLNGDARCEYVFAQNEVVGTTEFENYRQISCLTAIDEGGRVLWQKGEPDLDNYDLTSDLPVGVTDLNGDGKEEVVCCTNFELQVLDGATGDILRAIPTPRSKRSGGFMIGHETLFSRILGDCIAFGDLRGSGRGCDIILKDRYNDLWSYTAELEQLWSYSGKLAHSPLVWDFDGDGRDEVFAGDALIDDDGSVLWSLELFDHCDSAVFYWRDGKPILCVANQNGGFYFLDARTGKVLREWRLGHAQVLSLGNYDPSAGSRLICAQTYWGGLNQYVFDLDGGLTFAGFEEVYGWVPVNWVGDGTELLAAPRGLYDCYGNLVVEFPVPLLKGRWGTKVYARDVCGDARDEVLAWDESHLVVYTQVGDVKGRLYKPYRRLCNQTFYGNAISEPGWAGAAEP